MALRPPAAVRRADSGVVKAVLGPTNTGKTHLAIERLCAHSSGAIGFPLRLLAREVYDRVCAIKGAGSVALITGEERIEPPQARWLLCTAEAMPVDTDLAFVALDEAQLAADRERGHLFTDRLLHARGRQETMLLGSSAIEPLVRKLVPEAEILTRPRFSTLRHSGLAKLSRIPPRSAIVAFSAEQVYAVAEMLRRFRGGAAVVMGALSPETRNKQVALYQSGEVDYLVATDAIGMGLNLDLNHVAFAGLSKFDGQRQRRLTTAEMAQIAGRAGRHQRDGTFGTLGGRPTTAFTSEEVYAIEEHRFPPLTKLFWRDSDPRFGSLDMLIADLEAPPDQPELAPAPEAVDLAVLKRLAEQPEIAASVRGAVQVERFWDVCRLPDFRSHGAETHSRFVARLWTDLERGQLGADYVAQSISALDNPGGDIDTLQGRIAAIRSWAYITQRPDWVLAREEMAARARSVEARLSDALHARLVERFVNRRTAVLMKKLGPDAAMLPVTLDDHGQVRVDGEALGQLSGFRLQVDPAARLADRRLLLAAAERHLPGLRAQRSRHLVEQIASGADALELVGSAIRWEGEVLVRLRSGQQLLDPHLLPDPALEGLPAADRRDLIAALGRWLATRLEPLKPLRKLAEASTDPAAGPELRALLIRLVEAGGMLERTASELERLDPGQRHLLRRLGVRIGALDLFVPALLKPAAIAAWQALHPATSALDAKLLPVISLSKHQSAPSGYRTLGQQAVRIDMAEKLLRGAHEARVAASSRDFVLNPAMAISMGLGTAAYARLLGLGGFRPLAVAALPSSAAGPPAPLRWRWRPLRKPTKPAPDHPAARPNSAFAALAELVR